MMQLVQKGAILSTIKKMQGQLSLKVKAEAVLIDHLVCYPGVITRVAPAAVVAKGFMENGMMDKKLKAYPDFYKILGTCQRKLTKEEL